MTTVILTLRVDASPEEAAVLIDEWVGLFAPVEVVSVEIEVEG